jgi:putative inorganic carbon (hco3(-)) transporter
LTAIAESKAEGLTGIRASASLRALLASEQAVLIAMLAALGIFYLVPGYAAMAVGLAAFFGLTLYRPQLSLAIVPLVAPLFFRPRVITDRYHVSLAEAVIVCGVAAWALRDGWAFLRARKWPTLDRSRLMAVLPAVALIAIGAAWLLVPGSAHRNVAFRDFRWTVLEPALFFALMLRWLRSADDVWRLVWAWLVGAALIGREGAEQFLFGDTWNMEGVGRVTSVYPSATAFGIYMGRALPMAVVLAIFLPAERRLWKLAAALLSVSIGLGVLLSFARGAWIGVFVALAVVALITRNRWLAGLLGVGLLAGLVALPFVHVERITSMFNFDNADNTGLSRLKIWAAALRVLSDHPFTGIGQDQFLYVDPKYGVPNIRFLTVSHPHNWILDFWLRLGLPGLAWLVAALAYFFTQALYAWRGLVGTALGALTLGLLASMIDFVVHGLMDMAYFSMDLALSFWLLFGLLVLVVMLSRPGEQAWNTEAKTKETAKTPRRQD